MLVIEVIPFSNFKEKVRLTKSLKGKIEIVGNLIILERRATNELD